MTVRTRFAPSPTGFLHVGSARTALYAWLFARKHGGQFILRIEDTDKEREVEGAIGHMMQSLTWLGIGWDESIDTDGPYAPYIQSDRLDIYLRYAKQLIDAGFAYPDPYTAEEVEIFRKTAEDEGRAFLFRDHRPSEVTEWDGTQPLRFKVPTIKRMAWHDEVLGDLSAGEEALDDFILIKGDGYPTYNFAHVVDDIEMKITHVMRGHEFISSTPKFLSVYEALDHAPPIFVTLPPILADGGHKKLSKRDGAKDILEYRAEGYMPEAMVNFLALLGWNPGGDEEFFSVLELQQLFTLPRIQKSGAQFDDTKLLHINQHWMRTLSDEDYVRRGDLSAPDMSRLHKAVSLLKDRAQTFKEAGDMLSQELSCLFVAPSLDKDILVSKEPEDRPHMTKSALERLSELVGALPDDVSLEAVKDAVMGYANEEEAKGKGGRGGVLWPLRYALSGAERSPDPFTLVYILGPKESYERIQIALAIL